MADAEALDVLAAVLNWADRRAAAEARRMLREVEVDLHIGGMGALHPDLYESEVGSTDRMREAVRSLPDVPEALRTEEGIADAIGTVRAVGKRIVADGSGFRLTEQEADLLTLLARLPTEAYFMVRDETGVLPATLGNLSLPVRLLTLAAQAFWPVLAGEAKLVRCEGPVPYQPDSTCGVYFVQGGGKGRQRDHCSLECAKRATNRRRQDRRGTRVG